MKTIIPTFLLFLIAFSASAQLAGTKWKGKVKAPKPIEVIFDFKTDVANITTLTGMPMESCSYTIKADTITFKKVSGGSPCPVNSVFTVQYAITNNAMTINPLTDDCEGRKGSFTKEPLIKIND